MGRAKLLLPLGEKAVIVRLLDVLNRPEIPARLAVVRPGDDMLRTRAEFAGATVVVPHTPPPDMRTSVAHALASIDQRLNPCEEDAWMLVPADHPVLEQNIIDEIISAWRNRTAKILVPTCRGRRGHPTIFRWSLAREVASIPADRGLDWLLEQHVGEVQTVEIADDSILCDLDTPEDYERLRQRFET